MEKCPICLQEYKPSDKSKRHVCPECWDEDKDVARTDRPLRRLLVHPDYVSHRANREFSDDWIFTFKCGLCPKTFEVEVFSDGDLMPLRKTQGWFGMRVDGRRYCFKHYRATGTD